MTHNISPLSTCKTLILFFFFAADIRKLDIFEKDVPEIPSDGQFAVQKIIKKLRFAYSDRMFGNPELEVIR